MANQKKIELANRVEPELQVTQFFEPLKILIYNLVTNAIHFSEKADITIQASENGNNITISVSDEGSGMTPEQIKNIMADQFIVSSANVDNKKGNGLGYLIIKDLLKMMGAQIQISSEKNIGTTVYVELPK
ncbi:MAG: ATP-binding protein [Chitinophagaceae bacterium]|nr:ATP-binding protein [Chitinophagaceae bacterium]